MVGSAAAGKHELAIEVALDKPIGADHSHRVLQAIETRDLRDDRAVRIDVEACDHLVDKLGIEILVLLGERVDRGIKEILRDRQLPRERWRRKNAAVISIDPRLEEVPD